MPIPLGVYLGIAGGTALVNWLTGRSAAKASEKAATQQQEGVREARAYAEPLYQRAQDIAAQTYGQGSAALAPYAQQGGAGLTALSNFLGVRAPAPAAAPRLAPLGAFAPAPGPLAPTRVPPPGAPLGASAEKRAAQPELATRSSYVTLRAPTGQVRPVPADQVDFYLARGATRV
jgi:hypothetical protein